MAEHGAELRATIEQNHYYQHKKTQRKPINNMINNIAIKTNILLFLILSSFAQAAEDSPRLLLTEAHALSAQLAESETAHDPVAGPEEAVASVELVEVVITNNGTRWVAVSSLTDVVDIALGGVTWICAEKRLLTRANS